MNVNTFKSAVLNQSDVITTKESAESFNIDNTNSIRDNVILLYIYRLSDFQNHGFKVGYTICKWGVTFWHAIKSRIDAQVHELALNQEQFNSDYEKYGVNREVVFWGINLDANDDSFKDHEVHRAITAKLPGIVTKRQEWFQGVSLDDLKMVFLDYRKEKAIESHEPFEPRKEQREAVDAMKTFFAKSGENKRFLLNCKMRFGKCFTTYKYAEESGKRKILILTFVPAVEESWRVDLKHIAKEYDYFTDHDFSTDSFELDNEPTKPYVAFLSLQNYLGKDAKSNDTKDKIKKISKVSFDLLILDEYHFGAWNDRTQETLEEVDSTYLKKLSDFNVKKDFNIEVAETICLSGTPFKAIDRGEFTDKNSFTYSYFDEQRNKYPNLDNNDNTINKDYAHFPDMKIFGYNMNNFFGKLLNELHSENKILKQNYFSLNAFFKTKNDENSNLERTFIYENEIKEWLEIIKGRSTFYYDFPYRNKEMLDNNKHTLWLLPSVNACGALAELLRKDDYFCKYKIINLSANEVGAGYSALRFLNNELIASEQGESLGSITITVNKLTLGVTVKKWSSIFVLKDLSSPEQYFQSIFRVQSPNVVDDKILKKVGYVYDFNIDRAAALLLHYAERTASSNTKLDVANLIVKYLPIYINGDLNHPIDVDVFYQLASFGYNSKPLSEKVKDISKTTRGLDDQTIADMLNDKECSEVIKNVFAHAKFAKPKTTTTPASSKSGFDTIEAKLGRNLGYEQGLIDYSLYLMIDDEEVQKQFDDNSKKLATSKLPSGYTRNQEKYFINGYLKGYISGVNIPIKKMQPGKEDGKKFVEAIKQVLGADVKWLKTTQNKINELINNHLNDKNNIPEKYRKFMYLKWYCESFRASVKSELRPKIREAGGSVEATQNVLKHILSRVFQFLFISVYRETKFKEIFANANPDVFLAAVGITKKDFEILNKYHVFQERVLDGYIHEFFVNESLGKKMNNDDKRYRNSFNWFGYGIEVKDEDK